MAREENRGTLKVKMASNSEDYLSWIFSPEEKKVKTSQGRSKNVPPCSTRSSYNSLKCNILIINNIHIIYIKIIILLLNIRVERGGTGWNAVELFFLFLPKNELNNFYFSCNILIINYLNTWEERVEQSGTKNIWV
jgi:hypothetical protein